jgi:hypothetical protein
MQTSPSLASGEASADSGSDQSSPLGLSTHIPSVPLRDP